jgi:hypothetical protein
VKQALQQGAVVGRRCLEGIFDDAVLQCRQVGGTKCIVELAEDSTIVIGDVRLALTRTWYFISSTPLCVSSNLFRA